MEEEYEEETKKGIGHYIGAIFGERIYLGLIMGMFFGIVAGYDFKGIADVTIKTAALMELFPTMVKMLVNGFNTDFQSSKAILHQAFCGP